MEQDQSKKPYEPSLQCFAPDIDGEIDVVFVHGLLGSANGTWTAERGETTFHWPSELQKDLTSSVCRARVWALDYNAPALQKDPPGILINTFRWLSSTSEQYLRPEQHDTPLNLKDRAQALCRGLLDDKDRLGKRPIVFVAHSLGGLLVKAMLDREWVMHGNESSILRQTRAVVFLGTPHSGSAIADYALTLSKITVEGGGRLGELLAEAFGAASWVVAPLLKTFTKWAVQPSDTVKVLERDNPELLDIMRSYRSIAIERKIETLSCSETRNWKGIAIIVSPTSADPGVGETVPLDGYDHERLAKPSSVNDQVYRIVRRVIARVAIEAQKGTRRPVFDEQAEEILGGLRVNHFPTLPVFAWEEAQTNGKRTETSEDIGKGYIKEIRHLPRNDKGGGGRNFRRRVAVEFFRLCEEMLRQGSLKVGEGEARAAHLSQFDIDKFVLIAWHKHRLSKAIGDARSLVEEQCSYVRSNYKPTLTVLYRAVDSLDKTLTDQMTLSLGTELRLTRDDIIRRSRNEGIDEDGITRGRLDDLLTKIRVMAETSLEGEHAAQPGAAGGAPQAARSGRGP